MANTLDTVLYRIKQKMNDNPKIHDISHVGLEIKAKGILMWRKYSLQIVGRVNREEELDEINSIVEQEAEGCDVVNTIRVQNRS